VNIRKKYKNKKYVIPIVALITLGIAGIAAYTFARYSPQPSPDYVNQPVSGGIDYSGPSEEEKKYNEEQEKRNQEREALDQQSPSKTADIIVASAGQHEDTIEVRAYVTNLYEDGGSCAAVFTKDGYDEVSTTTNALPDAKTIQCGPLDIARSHFPQAGTWELHVTYQSPTATGKSTTQRINIQ